MWQHDVGMHTREGHGLVSVSRADVRMDVDGPRRERRWRNERALIEQPVPAIAVRWNGGRDRRHRPRLRPHAPE
jgi:hypothetical protein